MDDSTTIPAGTPQTPIEGWFASIGLEVDQVDRCPIVGCSACSTAVAQAA